MEKSRTARTAVALAGSLALAGSAALVAAPYAQAYATDKGVAVEAPAQSQVQRPDVQRVEGVFAFDQTSITPNAIISSVFNKAAATLCASLPDYGATAFARQIGVSGPDGQLSATVDELSNAQEAQSHVMACSCATNLPGGGAIANAEVAGVTLGSLAQMVGAR